MALTFDDFTTSVPAAGDYVVGFDSAGGAGSDRKYLRSSFANPPSDDGLPLGVNGSLRWSDLNLATGAVIDFGSDVQITHSANALAFAGAANGYTFDDDIFLPSGGKIDFGAGNLTVTHGTGVLFIAGIVNAASNVASPAAGSSTAFVQLGSAANFGIYWGTGAPTVSAASGSLYIRNANAGANLRLYVNTTGSTTWAAVTSA